MGRALLAACALLRRAPTPFVSTYRLLVWTVVVAIPVLALGALRPCVECNDLSAALMHEIGHALGLGHGDDEDAAQTCGCGAAARACTRAAEDARDDVMHSLATTRATLCLSRDDVDGVRTLRGGECDDPVWCYESPAPLGYARTATAPLRPRRGGLVVCLRDRREALRRRRPRPTTRARTAPTVVSARRRPPPPARSRI